MVKAFVFGKFLPFHLGHKAMIDFALEKCDALVVLVCCSDKENIPAEIRMNWITETFAPIENVEVRKFMYTESELPNTSESSIEVSKIWSEKFKNLFIDFDLVVTSEKYGDYVADFMGIKHIPFDISKQLHPVSATSVLNDLFGNWKYLPQSVKPYFAIKIVILGTESTGKSTLLERLVNHYNCSGVKETGRELIENSNSFGFEELHLVAEEHASHIEEAVRGNSPLVLIDTDVYITKSYAKFLFDEELVLDEQTLNANKADLYLYLDNDVEYLQDGTRLSKEDRNLLDKSHRGMLRSHKVDYKLIQGNWEQRFQSSIRQIDLIIRSKK